MPGATVPFGFPYPVGADPFADPAGDIQALAESVDTAVQTLFDQVDAAGFPPAALVGAGPTQVASNTTVAPPLTTTQFDNDGMTSTLSVNPFELIIQTAGIYAVWGSVLFPSSTTTFNYGVGVFINGAASATARSRNVASSAGGSWRAQFGTLESLAVGDRVALAVYFSIPTVFAVTSTSGGALGLVRVAP